jgi:hypothetical protein
VFDRTQRLSLNALVLLAMLGARTTPLSAQGTRNPPAQPESIPTALATSMLMVSDRMDPATRFVVGRVPDGWPAALVPAPSVRVIGGSAGRVLLTALFEYPMAASAADSSFEAMLRAAGWWRAPKPRYAWGVSNRSALFCHGKEYLFPLRMDSLSSRTSIVAMYYDGSAGYAPMCDTTTRAPVKPPPSERDLLTLSAPAGARTVYSNTWGNYATGEELSMMLETSMSADTVLARLAGQLTAEGWGAGRPLASEGAALQTLRRIYGAQLYAGTLVVRRIGPRMLVLFNVRSELGP